jgi:hypothetical protein
VIVVVGSVAYRLEPDGTGRAVGIAPAVAAEAVAAGASVEMLTGIGEDGAGEELLLALARNGVGHLAVRRDPTRPTTLVRSDPGGPPEGEDEASPGLHASTDTPAEPPSAPVWEVAGVPPASPGLEPADIALGLQYLRDFRVVVVIEPLDDGAPPVIADASAFAGASLVVVAHAGWPVADAYATATVLEAPADDGDGAFARLVGRFAAGIDGGTPAVEAFRAATAADGWEAASG